MSKEKKIVKWTDFKIPDEIERDLFPDADWSEFDKHYEGEVLDTVMGVWDDFFVVECSDGKLRRVNTKLIKEIKDG